MMSRIIRCELCGIAVKCKKYGRPKTCCSNCRVQKDYDIRIAYIKKHRKKILLRAKKYREANREKIREESRLYTLRKARARKEHDEKLLADIIANPRKYLKRLGGN